MDYYDLITKVRDLNLKMEGALPNRTTGIPQSIDGMNFKYLWLHFGLNGSDHDTAKGEVKKDCFIKSIEHLNDNSPDFKKVRNLLLKEGFIYDRYFSKPVTFYSSVGWYQIWQHPEFFTVFPHYLSMLKEIPGVVDFLYKNQKSLEDRYVVFSDLLFIRDRNSKNIGKSSVLETLEDLVWELWNDQINYFNPMGVTIANAKGQAFIKNKLKVDKYSYFLEYDTLPIIFSSQFSGGVLSDPLFGLLRDLFVRVSTQSSLK